MSQLVFGVPAGSFLDDDALVPRTRATIGLRFKEARQMEKGAGAGDLANNTLAPAQLIVWQGAVNRPHLPVPSCQQQPSGETTALAPLKPSAGKPPKRSRRLPFQFNFSTGGLMQPGVGRAQRRFPSTAIRTIILP
jgi:hypothetical protein